MRKHCTTTPEGMGRMRWMGLMGVFSYCHYPSLLFFLFYLRNGNRKSWYGLVWFSNFSFLPSSSFSFFSPYFHFTLLLSRA
ncbi:hypothetical protein B9Z19DRAFT_297910 [Tuber borchii]|uniref:Uncharacterized protein n=1 Tax=Tuber borchii TaxID=42251 RepID=A0A2T6ZKB5_TUBBO|nr:hypothetical protein B9Z19DRAFT_297910 [Tuber borchii]